MDDSNVPILAAEPIGAQFTTDDRQESKSKSLLFVIAEGRYFMSHRLHLARSAVAHGYRVAVLCRATGYRDRIEDAGFEVFDWRLSRGSLNPRQELRALLGVLRALRQFRPELVHVVALKPSIYVALANSLERVGSIVYALGGLGFVFTSRRVLARSLRPILLLLFRWMFRRKSDRLILQNPDDQALLLAARVIDPKQVRLIRGAGVDTRVFSPRPKEDSGVPLVVLPARLLWDKGVGEFVEAARSLRQRGVSARFILVGEPDPHNPECVPEDQVESWVNEGVVEAWGNREDMPDVLNRASIICLPSYREGLPKALLEAASCAKPIVTFDVPGCREVVVEGLNGFLVPPRDVLGLIGALQSLLSDSELCERMGVEGRKKVLREFSQERIAEETLLVWREALI